MSVDNSTPAPGREPFSTPEEVFESLTGEPARPPAPLAPLPTAPPIPGELLTAPRHDWQSLTEFRAECEQLRQRIVDGMRSDLDAGREPEPVFLDQNEDFVAVLLGQKTLRYSIPRLSHLWDKAYVLDLGTVPPFPGEPSNGREALEALDTLLSWCRSREAIGASGRDSARAESTESGEPAAESATTGPGELPSLLSAADLARALQQPVPRVESFLRRYRADYPDCCTEVEGGGTRKNEPRYLYRFADVWPLLQQQLPKWRKLADG
jgi:hypothetical protein